MFIKGSWFHTCWVPAAPEEGPRLHGRVALPSLQSVQDMPAQCDSRCFCALEVSERRIIIPCAILNPHVLLLNKICITF